MTAQPATFYWPGYEDMAERPSARLHHAKDGIYAVVELAEDRRLNLHLHTAAQCDALIVAAVAAKDLLVAAQAPPPTCLTCGAATGLDPVHVKATIGTAARTEHYCHDVTACHHRRHPALPGMIAALDGLTGQATP